MLAAAGHRLPSSPDPLPLSYAVLYASRLSVTGTWHLIQNTPVAHSFTENLSENEQLAWKYLYIETRGLLFGIIEAYCHVKILGINTGLV